MTQSPTLQSEADRTHLRRAIELARRGWGQTSPNPMVGAVVVRDGVVVGEGWHARYGEPHAEVAALREAGERARGATVYVSLEPCDHEGKTPPCTRALIDAGVARVVAAIRDPNPRASGGAERLRGAGIQVQFGPEGEVARELNAPFISAFQRDRPWVTLKLALSLDGAIADATRRQRWLTGASSRREVHRLRAGSDAIAVGAGTVRADDPLLTVRDAPAPRVPPTRVVFDSTATLDLSSRLARTARELPTLVVATAPVPAQVERLAAVGVEVLHVSSAEEGMRQLFARGVRSLLVEGGAGLAGALLSRALVDRLIIFQAPVVLGAGALPAFGCVPTADADHLMRLPVLERRAFDDDLMTAYALSPTPEVP